MPDPLASAAEALLKTWAPDEEVPLEQWFEEMEPHVTALRAALAEHRQRDERGEAVWLPIETAPGDGTAFLAVATVVNNETGKTWQEQHVVWIDSESGAIADEAYQGWDAADYTHWRPLPEPPAAAGPRSRGGRRERVV